MEPMTPEPSPKVSTKTKSLLGSVALIAGIGLAGYFSSGGLSGQDPDMSSGEAAQRVEMFQSAGNIYLPIVTEEERDKAVSSMDLPPEEQVSLKQDLQDNKVKLVWFTLWDDKHQDGDIVSLSSEGFLRTILLKNAPERVAIPAPNSGIVNVIGGKDGGGGITIGLKSGETTVPLPRMRQGQTISVPVQSR